MRSFRILALILFACVVSAQWMQAEKEPTFTKFNAPHAGRGAGQGTFPWGIIQGQWIMGYYIDAESVYHGFLRAPDGTITEFDVPGQGTQPGQGTVEVFGMTPQKEIVGTYLDANNLYHGFLRTSHGEFISFDCPGQAPVPIRAPQPRRWALQA